MRRGKFLKFHNKNYNFTKLTFIDLSRFQLVMIICYLGLIVCHLPHGPTAYFTISDLVMRHDIPNIGNMSEAYPHLIFHNFKSRLGERVSYNKIGFLHQKLLIRIILLPLCIELII